jgi:hypothetical protein
MGADIRLVQRLAIETHDPTQFFAEGSAVLARAKALETVTFVRVGQSKSYEAWWEEWNDWMQMCDLMASQVE